MEKTQPCPLCRGEGHYVGPKVEPRRNFFIELLFNITLSFFVAMGFGGLFVLIFGPGDGATSFGASFSIILFVVLSIVAGVTYTEDASRAGTHR